LTDDASLFVSLAEIAGVFVGFGALISFTRRGEIDALELGYMRGVVSIGLSVVTASLVPIGLARFGPTDRVLWLTSSLVFLIVIWFAIIVSLRAAESREQILAPLRENPITAAFFFLLLELSLQVPLVLVALGIFPDQAPALYTMALVVSLLEAAFLLAVLVFHRPINPSP
jgi:hypothetical protein